MQAPRESDKRAASRLLSCLVDPAAGDLQLLMASHMRFAHSLASCKGHPWMLLVYESPGGPGMELISQKSDLTRRVLLRVLGERISLQSQEVPENILAPSSMEDSHLTQVPGGPSSGFSARPREVEDGQGSPQ